jgi:ketosteroid isomerase-like protein
LSRATTLRVAGLALAAGVASASGCAPRGSEKQAFTPDVHAASELMAADRAFARDTSARGLDGWLDAFTDDGVQLPTGQPLARGKAELRAVMQPILGDPSTRLRWDPDHASVSASGDLGYTIGRATVGKVGPSGGEVEIARLKYLTVWKRQPDGHWKVAAEVGAADP